MQDLKSYSSLPLPQNISLNPLNFIAYNTVNFTIMCCIVPVSAECSAGL